MSAEEFIAKIERNEIVVGIVGLGYVGLPLMLTFASKKVRCVGFDIDTKKIEAISAGQSYIRHIDATLIKKGVDEKLISATTDFTELKNVDAILMCVPTPLNKYREPDMSYVEGTAKSIAPNLRKGHLVVLESTTYPGTTDELLKDILESGSRLKVGDDFFLAYSPEREDPGNPNFDTKRIPKVVGGLTHACREVSTALYQCALDSVIPVSSTRVAEMTKLLENIFRSVNIALVNEMKTVCHEMGIDIWEVIEAAKTKPFGFMPFYPGPGLGGHCIPIDPFYLTWKAREHDLSTRFIELAGEVNTAMPDYVISRIAEVLNTQKKAINGSKFLILGLAYKKDVDDERESPSYKIMELLSSRGAELYYHDNYIPKTRRTRKYDWQLESTALSPKSLGDADAVLILTAHSDVDYAYVVEHAKLVIDTRNATQNVDAGREKIHKA